MMAAGALEVLDELEARREKHHLTPAKLTEQVADRVTAFTGSWWFLLVHIFWWGPWIVFHVEPFPYGLLTMILSLEAIVLSTVIMISQNRQAKKDRAMAAQDDYEIGELWRLQKKQDTHDEWTRATLERMQAALGEIGVMQNQNDGTGGLGTATPVEGGVDNDAATEWHQTV
jgi:low affinity Fe/Cu permease